MSGAGIRFKRMVVGLPHGTASQDAVHAAADLAEFLDIELLAAFVADATLPALAELSGAREIGMLGQERRTIDRAQIVRDIDRAIGVARRRFAESIESRAIKTSFNVLTGAEAIAALIRADDIVAIIEPGHPAERIAWQFTALLEAAFAMAGAVLVVPRRIVRTAGPIVTVASHPHDQAIRAALEIAAVTKERLIVITAAGALPPIEVLAEAKRLGVQVESIAGRGFPIEGSGQLQERLRVLTRTNLADDATRMFLSLQGIPLLVLESSRTEDGTERKTEQSRQVNRSAG